jgi:hypothetical protein
MTTAIQGLKKIRGDAIKRKFPLRLCHLNAFLKLAYNSGSYDDLLFITILSCCFYACHWSGELIQKGSSTLLDWQKIIKQGSLTFESKCAKYHLPYPKGDPFYHRTDILFTTQDVADPVTLLYQYALSHNKIHSACTTLFLQEDGCNPTRVWFDSKFFSLLGHDYGGHSPRTGGAMLLASLSLSEDIIQVIGRLSSAAWKLYIRDNPTVQAEQLLASLQAYFHAPQL